jgi:transcriptional regulator with XRE-family HTH domain
MLRLYRSYVFIDKDPVIDVIRTAMQDAKVKPAKVARDSGVSPTTLGNWFHGPTRRPQFSTVAAVANALGKPIRFGGQEVTPSPSKPAMAALRAQEEREAQRLLRKGKRRGKLNGKRKHLPKRKR